MRLLRDAVGAVSLAGALVLAATQSGAGEFNMVHSWTITCPKEDSNLESYLRRRSAWGFTAKIKASMNADAIKITLQNCSIDADGVREMMELKKFIESTDNKQWVSFQLFDCTFPRSIDWKGLDVEQKLIRSTPAAKLYEPSQQRPIPRKMPNNRY